MKNMTHLFLILFLSACNAQQRPDELRFSQVNWTLKIPPSSKILDKQQIDSLQKVTVDKLKVTKDEIGEYETLFIFLHDRLNGFSSTINKFDKPYSVWVKNHELNKQFIIKSLQDQKGNIEIIDTLSSREVIDGASFAKFYVEIMYPGTNIKIHNYWYNRQQNRYDCTISINIVDEEIGKECFDLFRVSKIDH